MPGMDREGFFTGRGGQGQKSMGQSGAGKIILAGCSPKKSTPTLMFELNGSYSDVQKTKTKTANRSRFWLPKVGTLDETIEERCAG